MVETIIFDLFNTLAKWSPNIIPSAAHIIWLKSPIRDELRLDNIIGLIDGKDGDELWPIESPPSSFQHFRESRIRSAIKLAKISNIDEVLSLCLYGESIRQIELFSDVLEVLRAIQGQSLSWILCSNCSPDILDKFLELLRQHDIEVPSLAVSHIIGATKPHSRVYKHLVSLVKNPERCLFVGDNIKCDVISPRKFGFQSLHIDRTLNSSRKEWSISEHSILSLNNLKLLLVEIF